LLGLSPENSAGGYLGRVSFTKKLEEEGFFPEPRSVTSIMEYIKATAEFSTWWATNRETINQGGGKNPQEALAWDELPVELRAAYLSSDDMLKDRMVDPLTEEACTQLGAGLILPD